MNISRRGHNTCNGSVARRILAVIHNDSVSNTASRDFISEIMHSSKPTQSNWVNKSVSQACVTNVCVCHSSCLFTQINETPRRPDVCLGLTEALTCIALSSPDLFI